MRRIAWIAPVLLLPGNLFAQLVPAHLGAGVAWTRGDSASGHGLHARLEATAVAIDDYLELRMDAVYQRTRLGGFPFGGCARVAPSQCWGRTDRRTSIGVGSSVVLWLDAPDSRVRVYLVPLAVGAYHQRLESTEVQGPRSSLCIRDGALIPCEDDTPWATLTASSRNLGVGLGSGTGFDARIGRVHLFLDIRTHRFWGLGKEVEAAPVVLGVSLGGPGGAGGRP